MQYSIGTRLGLVALMTMSPWSVSAQWRAERMSHERTPMVESSQPATSVERVAVSPLVYGTFEGAAYRSHGTFGADSVPDTKPSRRGRHAVVGALLGGTAGLALGWFGVELVNALVPFGDVDGAKQLQALLVFTASGAAIGAGIGALFP